MQWLNYHHLLYFWTVAREGGIGRAGQRLHLSQPTISAQLRTLERSIGRKLFERSGRGLALTETGRVVYRYADEIFSLGRELLDTLQGRPSGGPLRLVVGVADVLPKLVARRLLEPALRMPQPVHIVCREGTSPELLADLSLQNLDLVLSDAPVGPQVRVRAYSHLLGECGSTFFASAGLAARCRRGFPGSLDGVPVLLPGEGAILRRSLEQWFEANGVRPVTAGEFDDSALLKTFGETGMGVFCAPTVVEKEICRQHRVAIVGREATIRERFYAISVERRLKHPAVLAICESARKDLFG